MSCVTKNVAEFVKEKGFNLSKMARDTGVSYSALYASLYGTERNRSLRDDEFLAICRFMHVNPMDFANGIKEAEKDN